MARTFEQVNIEYNQTCAQLGDFEYRVTLERKGLINKIEALRDEAAEIQKSIASPITSISGQVAEKLLNADDSSQSEQAPADQAVS